MTTSTMKDFDDFIEEFGLIPYVDPDATSPSLTMGNVELRCGIETFGRHLEYANSRPRQNIWTLIEEEGAMYIVPGSRLVNRIVYLESARPWRDGEEVFLYAEFSEDGDF